ncbi:MAG: HisA/HisF-related TIM barrel protein, partial [Candidatus Diapherotrites archaeon]|nr:HisA/HisF-related TIM barrel protein [Candidatus Diapherotrites archaeon]
MTVYPAIDLLNGKAVQLIQGKEKKFELNNPVQLAQKFNVWSTVHLIDLNAAMGQGNNQEIVKEILKLGNCRVGGGIRSIEKAQQLIEWDAEKVIIGTQANPKFLKELK